MFEYENIFAAFYPIRLFIVRLNELVFDTICTKLLCPIARTMNIRGLPCRIIMDTSVKCEVLKGITIICSTLKHKYTSSLKHGSLYRMNFC